jgi:uncharacterized repeat protein (TIGR03803 family)
MVGANQGGITVTNTLRDRISKMPLETVRVGLAFVLVLGIVTAQSAQAQTFSVLHYFTGYASDGEYPYAGLVLDAQGNLYGTTATGGSSYHGTVFKVSKSGQETLLHNFTGGTEGAYPYSRLILDAADNLYGTTAEGGRGTRCSGGCGTIFKVSKGGKKTVLHNFAGYPSDGCNPYGGLIRDATGNLYGTTYGCGSSGYGTVYELSKNGKEKVLHSFSGGPSDGAQPYWTGLLMDAIGNLYGVTKEGGTANEGVVYKLSKTGTLTVLHSFASGKMLDGCYAYGAPTMDAKGNLYGTTNECGSFDLGTVWKLSTNGTESLLHSFAFGTSDGAYPDSGVIMDAKGNLYGTTDGGGSGTACVHGCGTVYKLSKAGTMILLHSFNGSDGQGPQRGLTRDAKGNLYGTTFAGGQRGRSKCTDGCGTVFKLTP